MSTTTVKVDERAAPPPAARLDLSLCLTYGLGTVGTAILLNTVTTYFPAMMATVLGRSAAVAGLLLTVSKLYDIVADLVIGAVSDRTQTRWGRRRPFLFAGAIVSAIAFAALFAPPPASAQGLLIYAAAMLVLYSTGYSLFNVPYIAMPAEMTEGYEERTRLLSYRTAFAGIGQIIAFSGSGWLLLALGHGSRGYAMMGVVLAVIIAITCLISFYGTAQAAQTRRVHVAGLGVLKYAGLIFTNRPLVLLISAKFTQFISLAILTSTSLLFRLNVLKIGYGGQAEISLVQNVVTIISMPFWVWVGARLGKKWGYILSIVIYCGSTLAWWWTGPGTSRIALDVIAAVMGFAVGGILLMSISMLPDIMEYDFLRTGLRREGVFSSFYAIVEKVGFAIGPGIAGVYLAHAGYVSSFKGALVHQPASAVRALYVTNSAIPTGLMLVSIILISFYNIDRRTLKNARAATVSA